MFQLLTYLEDIANANVVVVSSGLGDHLHVAAVSVSKCSFLEVPQLV